MVFFLWMTVGNPVVRAQFEISPDDNLSASAPNAESYGRQIRYFVNGRILSDHELPLQRAVTKNRTVPPMEMEVHLPSGRRWFLEGKVSSTIIWSNRSISIFCRAYWRT
jgi:hypothetical protein